ncbi:MAG: hypothetical protein KVP17_001671 [Porospora cf. gigantea B]|uniref:uncharacterized protein n=1 Tax=Porospora cf. gigantea B TaxID=2853592 RepID=UPI003571B8A6|nr:MAG: hypothetical protein KVP17_001671 [Porospora cf. gigantea B]
MEYEGVRWFRQRLALSLVSQKPITFTDIRVNAESPGIRAYETKVLEMVDQCTDGTEITIDSSGTQVSFDPGQLIGGELTFNCGQSRCISYFLEFLLMVAPFSKDGFNGARLLGCTNGGVDVSTDPPVDFYRITALPFFKRCLPEWTVSLSVDRRGLPGGQNGQVTFTAQSLYKIPPLNATEVQRFKRVRGLAYTRGVNPAFARRTMDSARGVLHTLLPDVWIYQDVAKGEGHGFGLCLMAETINGLSKGSFVEYDPKAEVGGETPFEYLGRKCAQRLLLEIAVGGVCDSNLQVFPLLWMAAADEVEVSQVVLGHLTPYSAAMIDNLHDFLQAKFHISEMKESLECGKSRSTFHVKCLGCGLQNTAKKVC